MFMLKSCFHNTSNSKIHFRSKSKVQKELRLDFKGSHISQLMKVSLHTMCYQRQVRGQVLIQWFFCREKKIFPSCVPIYSKLKKIFNDQKAGKRNKKTTFIRNPMLMLNNLSGEALFNIY